MSDSPNALRTIVKYACGCRFVRAGRYGTTGPAVTPTPGMPVRCPEHGATELSEYRTVSTKVHRDCRACYGRGFESRPVGRRRDNTYVVVGECRPCAGWGIQKRAA